MYLNKEEEGEYVCSTYKATKYHFPTDSMANGPCPLENLILHLRSLISSVKFPYTPHIQVCKGGLMK